MKKKIIAGFLFMLSMQLLCFISYGSEEEKSGSAQNFLPKAESSLKQTKGLSVGIIYSDYSFEVIDGVLIASKNLANGIKHSEKYSVNDFFFILKKSNFQQEKYKDFRLLLLKQKSRGGVFARLYAIDPVSFERIKGKIEISES